MQMQLPIFPRSTKLLSATWGVFQKGDSVYYLHNGSPVYTHHKDDLNTYRYVTANLIVNNSCCATKLSAVFGVSARNFQRYAKRLRAGGSDAFFNLIDNRGRCHKMTPDKLTAAQKYLDLGYSQQRTGKAINVNEATIRYHLRKGSLTKTDNSVVSDTVSLKSITERNAADVVAGESLGIATTRFEERMDAFKGVLEQTPIEFIASEGVEFGGVLFLLPSLLATGLLSYQKHYTSLSGYYDLDTIILSLALMYLCRIKNPEQLKHASPGEFGKLLGLDRVPEAKNLRQKISQIVAQQKARQWNRELARCWVEQEETYFYYVDGHVKVYSGYKAKLGKKHISRLKLCLPGMTEFWVNNADGLPYFVVTGEVNEKMQQMIQQKILPELLKNVALKIPEEQLQADPDLPRFTLVFDRESYSPLFFAQLWREHRVAVISYRKNVTDKWAETDFSEHEVMIDSNKVTMDLAEKNITLNDVEFREVRKKNESSHQTSIITTNKKLPSLTIAARMFARWAQENFFKYLRQEYDLDRIAYYIVNNIDGDFKVVNPPHRKLTHKLKKIREKITRKKAKLYQLIDKNITDESDNTEENFKQQSIVREELQQLELQEQELIEERKKHPYKISIKEMAEQDRYNKLDFESKLFQNIIKMICYRAETSFSILLAANYQKKTTEMRALTKSLIASKANIIPDYENETLTVELYSLSNPRDNKAAIEICNTLNDSETKFPGTDLQLIYKFATI
jgi:hypothetical protein